MKRLNELLSLYMSRIRGLFRDFEEFEELQSVVFTLERQVETLLLQVELLQVWMRDESRAREAERARGRRELTPSMKMWMRRN